MTAHWFNMRHQLFLYQNSTCCRERWWGRWIIWAIENDVSLCPSEKVRLSTRQVQWGVCIEIAIFEDNALWCNLEKPRTGIESWTRGGYDCRVPDDQQLSPLEIGEDNSKLEQTLSNLSIWSYKTKFWANFWEYKLLTVTSEETARDTSLKSATWTKSWLDV